MTIPQIHDRLFRNVFGDRREAAALLRPHLPAPLADTLNWSTVTLLNRSYIDDDARASELDLLFAIERSPDEAPLALYVLLEHQSEPKRYMRLRLLKYCCRNLGAGGAGSRAAARHRAGGALSGPPAVAMAHRVVGVVRAGGTGVDVDAALRPPADRSVAGRG